MRALVLSAVATTAFVKGILVGLAVAGAVAACGCRRARRAEAQERPEAPEAAQAPEGEPG